MKGTMTTVHGAGSQVETNHLLFVDGTGVVVESRQTLKNVQ